MGYQFAINVLLALALTAVTVTANPAEPVHEAIATFIRESLADFRINTPISSGNVALTANNKQLVSISGTIAVELASFRSIADLDVLVDLHANGASADPQIKISLAAMGPIITGMYDLQGNVGLNETLGGQGHVTIIPHIEQSLNATCSLKVSTSATGHLQLGAPLGACYATTGVLPLVGYQSIGSTYVYYSPPLVSASASSLEADVNTMSLQRGGNLFGTRLGAGLMGAIVNHIQTDFNATKVLDILADSRPRRGRDQKANRDINHSERENVPETEIMEAGIIKRKMDEFAEDVIRALISTPAFDPFISPYDWDMAYNKPLVKLNGRISNASFVGFGSPASVEVGVTSCPDCTSVDTHVDVYGGQLRGFLQLSGNITADFPFAVLESSFLLTNVTGRFWMKPNFDVVDGRFKSTSTNMYWGDFSQTGGEIVFTPTLTDGGAGADLSEPAKVYLDQTVGRMILDRLNAYSGYADRVRDLISNEIHRKFVATPVLEMILA